MELSSDPDNNLVKHLKAHIELLEKILEANNIHVPESAGPTSAGASGGSDDPMAFPELDLSEPPPKEVEKLKIRSSIEDMPRICEAVLTLWGSDLFEKFVNGLVMDERGNRQGFSPDVMEELLLLGRVARARVVMIGTPSPLRKAKTRKQGDTLNLRKKREQFLKADPEKTLDLRRAQDSGYEI